jgi:hypothetical protein
MPPDTSDDAIRNRLFELMPNYPSKDACKMHLRCEGYPPDAVERVVDETYAIRKDVAMRRIQNQVELSRLLISILDGEVPEPDDAGRMEAVARETFRSIHRDFLYYTAILVIGAAGIAGLFFLALFTPGFWNGLVVFFMRAPLDGLMILGGAVGGAGLLWEVRHRWHITRNRAQMLKGMAARYGWRGFL